MDADEYLKKKKEEMQESSESSSSQSSKSKSTADDYLQKRRNEIAAEKAQKRKNEIAAQRANYQKMLAENYPSVASQQNAMKRSAYASRFAAPAIPVNKADPFEQYSKRLETVSTDNINWLNRNRQSLAELAQEEEAIGNKKDAEFYNSLSYITDYNIYRQSVSQTIGKEAFDKYESSVMESQSADKRNLPVFNFRPDGATLKIDTGTVQSWKDPDRTLYSAINGNADAINLINSRSVKVLDIDEQDAISHLNESERATYNYLYAIKGAKAAREFIENIGEELKRRKMDASLQDAADYAKDHKVWASALSIAASPLKVISSVGQAGDYLINGEVDPNAEYNFYSRAINEARQAAAGDMGKFGNFVYQTGMSIGDSLMSQLVGHGEVGSLIIMGGEAAADAVIEGKQRGLNDHQAFWLGQATGLVEVITEKIGLDNLFDLINSKYTGKELLKGILKQVGSEALEEGAADVADLMLDNLIAGDKAKVLVRYEQIKKEHPEYTDAQAGKKAMGEWLLELGSDIAGGALSGAVMGGRGVAQNSIQSSANIKSTAQNAIKNGDVGSLLKYANDSGLKTFGVDSQQQSGEYKNSSVYNLMQAVSEDLSTKIDGASLETANSIYQEVLQKYGDGVANLATEVYYESVRNDIETMKYVDGSIQGLRESFEAQTRNAETMTPMAESFRSAYAQEARARNRETESEAESSNAKQIMVDSAVQNIAARRSGAKMAEVTVKTENGRAETAQIEKMDKEGRLVLDNGQTVSSDKVDISDSVIEIQSLAKTYDLSSADTAQLFNLTLDHAKSFPSENVYDYFSQLVHAYEQGQGGKYTQQQAAKSFSVKGLLPVDHDLAYSLGRSRFNEASRQRAERLAQLKETAKKNGVTERRGTVDKSALADKNGRIKMNSDRAFAIRLSQAIAETLGVDVKLVEGDSRVEGNYGGRTITINVDQLHRRPGETVKGAITRALSHEVTHSFEKNSETYNELRQFCFDYAAQQIGVDAVEARIRAIQKLYNEAGLDYNRQDAEAEFVAQCCEQMLQNSDMLVELYKRSATLYQRFVDAINELFEKLKKIVSAVNENAKLMQGGMDQLQKLWDKCYAEASETIKNTALETSGEVEYSYAGETAKYADKSALETAKEMEKENASSEEIRQQTGWFKGYDGKWRFEINNEEMTLDLKGNLMSNPDVRRYNELFEKAYLYDTATENELKELQALESNLKGVRKTPKYLGEYIQHDALFKAYPELKNIEVVFVDNAGNMEGAYRSGLNEIALDRKLRLDQKRLKSVLIHEIQHAIQSIEGFAEGSSIDLWRAKLKYTASEKKNSMRQNLLRVIGNDESYKNLLEKFENRASNIDENYDDISSVVAPFYDKVFVINENNVAEAFLDYFNAYMGYKNLKYGLKEKAINNYKKTAGEIEARDAATRMDYTAEQRKNTRPDIDRTDVVFADNDKSRGWTGNMTATNDGESLPTSSASTDSLPLNGAESQGQKSLALDENRISEKDLENEINSAGLNLRSKENQRNNARIRNWIKENHPEISDVEFSNNRFEGRVTVSRILSEADVDAKNAANAESKKRYADEYARNERRRKFANKVNTQSGYESVYRSVENHISKVNRTGRNLSVEKSHSVVGSKSFYVIDSENDITIKISDHNTVNQQLEHPNTDFINLLRCESVNDLLNEIDHALSAKNISDDWQASLALDDSSYLSIAEKYRDGTATEAETEQLRQAVEQAARKAMPNTKILDEDGNLLTVYHGTSEQFTKFDMSKGRTNMDINGSFFSPWELDAQGYGENVRKFYLNITNPANESTGYKALHRFQGQNKAGVKAREYLESLGYDGVNNGNEEYIAFRSEQIKSADLVTYDDNGEIIPLSERFKSDNNDIRYSIAFDDSISDEDLLWQLRLEDAQTKAERNWLKDAQDKADTLRDLREQLKIAQKQIRAWEQKGKRSGTYSQQLIDSKNRDIRILENRIAKYEKILAGELKNPQLSRLLNEARTKAEAAMKAKKDQQMADYKESRRMTETRHKIKALKDVIDRRLMKPTVKQYVPQELLRATVDILEQIDTTYRQGAKSENAQTRLQALHSTYEKIKAEYPTAYSPIVAQMISELAGTVQGKTIYQLSSDELNDVHTALKAIYTTINNSITANEIEKGKYQWEIGADMIREIQSGSKNRFRLPQGFANLMTDAQRMFRRLGQYREDSAWNKVLKMLNNAHHDKATILYESNRIFDPVLQGMNGKKTLIQAAQDLMSTANSDLVDVGFVDRNGNKVKLTRDMMLALYMHSLNEQNTLHMLYGITLPGLEAYYSGKEVRYDAENGGKRIYYGSYASIEELNQIAKELKNADPDKAAALESRRNEIERDMLSRFGEMQNKIAEQLTDYEKTFIKCAQEFFRYAADRINDTTLKMYGFRKATVRNYFPIMTDSAFTKADMQTIVSDISIESWGNLKNRIEGARNPMYLNGFLDTISRHMDKMSTFAAMALPMNTFNGIWKTQFANYDTSMEDAFRNSVYGQRTYNWIENLYADLTGNRKSSGSKLLEKARGNIAPAALMFNVSVMAKQAASYPTAIATVGWAPAMKALVKGGRNGMMISRANTELINTYTPLLWLRSQGMIDPEINDAKNRQSGFAKAMQAIPGLKQFYNFGVNGIQAVDMATVGRLWSAAEYYVDKNFPALKKGTEAQIKAGESEYYQKVAEIFNKITEETQPDYTVLQRPDILRNKDSLVRSLTMFMTQRLQNFQIGYYAIDELQTVQKQYNENKTVENKARLQAARKNAFNGLSALLTSTIVIGVMTGVGKFLLHKPWRDDDDEVTVASTVDGVFWSCIESMAGNVVGGTEAYNLLRSIFGGDTYYGIEAQNISVISDLMDNIVSTTNWLRQNGLDASAEEWQKFLTKGAGSKLINSAAQLFGVPAWQIRNMIRGIYQHAMDGVGMKHGKYDRWWMTGYDYDNAKLLVEYVQDGNTTAAEYRYNEIMDKELNSGKTAEEAHNYAAQSIRSQVKEMYLSGDLDYEDALEILTGDYVGKEDDEAYWLLDEWQNTKDNGSDPEWKYSKYNTLHELMDDGEDISEEVKRLKDHGSDEKAIQSEIKSYAKQVFMGGDEAGAEAILKKYAGLGDDEIYWKLYEWEEKSGAESEDYDYSKYDELFDSIDRNVSKDQAFRYLRDGGYSDEQIISQAKQHIVDQYKGGKINAKKMANMLAQYCGITKTEDTDKIRYSADWKKEYPDYDISDSKAVLYYTKLKGTISAELWHDVCDQTGDISGEGKKQKQVDIIYQLCGYNRSKAMAIYKAMWPDDSNKTVYKYTGNW